MQSSSEICGLTAVEIAQLVRGRKLSAHDVTKAFLTRVNSLNGVVNAICTINPEALAEAGASDRHVASGGEPRPLEGVPFVVKDIIETKGLRTTFGSELRRDFEPAEDSVSVERLRRAGAILIGKTNTPEFAHDVNTTNTLFGTTRNPWQLDSTAGGSSGGTGAAIAASMAPIGLGTDLGGSIRVPASFNGVVGVRPSPGRIPSYPAAFAWDTLVPHVQGPMVRTVADAGLMLSVLSGPDDRDPSSLPDDGHDFQASAQRTNSMRGRRILFVRDFGGLVPTASEVGELVCKASHDFVSAGCSVEEGEIDTTDLREIIAGTRAFGMVARYGDLISRDRSLMTVPLVNQVDAAMKLSVAEIAEAERRRSLYWHRIRKQFERFDYIIAPATGIPAFRLDMPLPTEVNGHPLERFYDVFLGTYAFSITGLPIAAVPCGFTAEGLPVGMQIVARRQRDDLALEAAAAYEVLRPENFRSPEIDLTWQAPHSRETATFGYSVAK
ncbi:amidase [Rhodoligotrophos appendicifer]|uniref:amidase n=1 Tax=Rhodoligotrophos appendicifer TaxID=987056 RepID=UPI001184E521|nr:amidase family protein [Rhodoligotrophos appendicifer]